MATGIVIGSDRSVLARILWDNLSSASRGHVLQPEDLAIEKPLPRDGLLAPGWHEVIRSRVGDQLPKVFVQVSDGRYPERPRGVAELERQRNQPLHAGLDVVANLVGDWSGGKLRDDVSLLALERID